MAKRGIDLNKEANDALIRLQNSSDFKTFVGFLMTQADAPILSLATSDREAFWMMGRQDFIRDLFRALNTKTQESIQQQSEQYNNE